MCCALLSTLFPYTTLFRSDHMHQGERQSRVAAGKRLQVEIGGGRGGRADRIDNDHAAGRLRQPVVVCRSEEHTSELQSLRHLVCRLLLEKKKINRPYSKNQ